VTSTESVRERPRWILQYHTVTLPLDERTVEQCPSLYRYLERSNGEHQLHRVSLLLSISSGTVAVSLLASFWSVIAPVPFVETDRFVRPADCGRASQDADDGSDARRMSSRSDSTGRDCLL
jgi:hypothetical protein